MVDRFGFPVIIRPSFTLGGVGGGIAYNIEEFRELASRGIQLSPVHEVLIEESVIGWKEFELEVMRDGADNFVVICSIENIDPMGVHTGDSITVAPALTLTDKEYQRMRDAARRIITKVGVETGGSNISVRDQPRRRADPGDRDEPARLPLVGPRVEGDRVPHREDRGEARARLSARGDSQRHHPAHPGVVRTHDRLRRGEDPALDVREVPEGRPHPDDADEVRRRGDGDRPHVQGGVSQGHALARARAQRRAVRGRRRRRLRPAPAPARLAQRPAHLVGLPRPGARLDGGADRGGDAHRSLVPHAVRRDYRASPGGEPRRLSLALAGHPRRVEARRLRRRGDRRRPRRRRERGRGPAGTNSRSRRCTSASTPARRNSSRSPRTSTGRTSGSARPSRRTGPR